VPKAEGGAVDLPFFAKQQREESARKADFE
jgi:hypothetical protein